MDLFMGAQRRQIDQPIERNDRGSGRRDREPQRRDREPRSRSGGEDYSLQQESYRKELAFDRKRARRRKSGAVLRALGYCVGVPIALVIVFVVSYVLTCIVNGATPEEVVELAGSLFERVRGFVWQLMGT